jgi:hypothetical protein
MDSRSGGSSGKFGRASDANDFKPRYKRAAAPTDTPAGNIDRSTTPNTDIQRERMARQQAKAQMAAQAQVALARGGRKISKAGGAIADAGAKARRAYSAWRKPK